MAETASDRRARLMRDATRAAVGVAFGLSLAKLVAWSFTGSIAVLASLIDSLMDAGASLITMVAVRLSLKPADEDHRFGHGKSEALGGLAQAVLITISAVLLILRAVDRFQHPQALAAIPEGIVVMTLSMLVTLGLVLFQRHVVRSTDSGAIAADALHYSSDLATNLSTIAALIFAYHGFTKLDPVFAVAIAAATLYGAARIAWNMFEVLMDRELAPDVQERIRSIALGHASVIGVHDLRTRSSGQTRLIQFHLEMDGALSLLDAHRISDEVEDALHAAFPGADVVIHQEPVGICHDHRSE
jgi:ferrous-iron efflux pump FieF